MLIRWLRVRQLRSVVAVLFALLAVVSPLADVLAFGLHDHVAGAESTDRSQWSVPGDTGPTLLHHCELSISPIDVAPAPQIPPPSSGGPITPATSTPAPLAERLVQPSPPRA